MHKILEPHMNFLTKLKLMVKRYYKFGMKSRINFNAIHLVLPGDVPRPRWHKATQPLIRIWAVIVRHKGKKNPSLKTDPLRLLFLGDGVIN